MKLIKLTETHYVIVDNSKINKGDYFIDLKRESYRKPYLCDIGPTNSFILTKEINFPIEGCFKITHSNQPLAKPLFFTNAFESELSLSVNGLNDTFIELWGCKKLSLLEIEEAIYGYSVEKLAEKVYPISAEYKEKYKTDYTNFNDCWVEGFKAHQEITKDKLFTVKDIINAISKGKELAGSFGKDESDKRNNYINSLLPKTEWDIEIDKQSKIKLI